MDVLFYDPVRGVVATPLDYAIGPSNGHPAILLEEAVASLSDSIAAQERQNTERIGQLSQLSASIDENLSISSLRHREAVVAVRTRVDELVTALRRAEEHWITNIERDAEVMRRELEARRSSVRDSNDALTRANNILRSALDAIEAAARNDAKASSSAKDNNATAGDTGAADEVKSAGTAAPTTQQPADVLCALGTSREVIAVTKYYSFPEDTTFTLEALADVHAAVAPLLAIDSRPTGLYFSPDELTSQAAADAAEETQQQPVVKAERPDEVVYHIRRTVQSGSGPVAPGVVHSIATKRLQADGTLGSPQEYCNPVEQEQSDDEDAAAGDEDGLDVIPSVPVTAGDLCSLTNAQPYDAESSTFDAVRLASVESGALWWDFGANMSVSIEEYTLLHGGATAWGALRSWSVIGTNERPPMLSIAECADDAQKVSETLQKFYDEHCTIIDRRVKEQRMGSSPFSAVTCTAGGAVARRSFFRYVGVRVDGATGAGPSNFSLLLAGAEWFGSIRVRAGVA